MKRIINIKASHNNGISEILLLNIDFVIYPVKRLETLTVEIPNPYWITGFANGECTFDVKIYAAKVKVGYATQLRFRISQHSRDTKLIETLIDYFGAGVLEKESRNPAVVLSITKFEDILTKVIPFFEKYPL